MTYADGTAGHSGTDTSAERVEVEGPSLSMRLRETQVLLGRRGYHGLTSPELEEIALIHHGRASSALTNLHRMGLIARTATRRDGCKVYKHLDYLESWETVEPYVPRNAPEKQRIAELEDVIARARMAILTGEPALRILEES